VGICINTSCESNKVRKGTYMKFTVGIGKPTMGETTGATSIAIKDAVLELNGGG
jgi:hypothetical protein